MAAMYAAYHGPDGLASIARRVHRKAAALAVAMTNLGYGTGSAAFFDTVSMRMPGQAAQAAARAAAAGFNVYLASRTWCRSRATRPRPTSRSLAVASALAGQPVALPAEAAEALPAGLVRTTTFLAHPVFHSYRSETAMLRYLRRLADRDIALDRSMIPLGSCTMKLNAAAEMEAITLAGVRRAASVRPGGAGARVPAADRRAGRCADGDHRLRRHQPPAERRLARGAGRAAGDPRLPPVGRRAGAHRVPDPGVRARHERGQRRAGGPAGRGGQVRL